MKQTDRPYLATQDDDYIVTDRGWKRILSQPHEGICCQLPSWNSKFAQAYSLPFVNIGYGSVFPRALASEFFEAWGAKYGFIDESLILKGDRCFTAWVGRWLAIEADDTTIRKLWNPNGELSDRDPSSIHLQEDHWPDTWKAVLKARALSESQIMTVPESRTSTNN